MHELDTSHMARALELAQRGQGQVEPNPMVGCTIVVGHDTVGEGYHARFGGPHAEVMALVVAGRRAAGATAYVNLEPCCHQGKTPPCTTALIEAGIARVVVAHRDPFAQVAGQGIETLRAAGIEVEVGLLAEAARELNAPFLKLVEIGRPWIIAKWAMTLDGKLATRTLDSRWVSSAASRAVVHRMRGRMDAIMIGRGTATADDPLLTARPSGVRQAARIVVDSNASLPLESQLVKTARDIPVIVAAAADAPVANVAALRAAGCEVLRCEGNSAQQRLLFLLDELGRRQLTNVLVEGGSQLLGSLWDAGQIDEVHAFIAPKIVGGQDAPAPLAGLGLERMTQAFELESPVIENCDGDIYVHGRVRRR